MFVLQILRVNLEIYKFLIWTWEVWIFFLSSQPVFTTMVFLSLIFKLPFYYYYSMLMSIEEGPRQQGQLAEWKM